jgi:hypothetical protein
METENISSPAQIDLGEEQSLTLGTPRRRYGFLARLLFSTMDVVYGRKKTFSKFKVLEIIARVPYQSWEHVAYIAMTHTYSQPRFARRVFEFIKESRDQQDNEQWHLLILEELVQKKAIPENFILARIFPQIMAFFYYHVSWILYVIEPRLSYELNADFEDHAEHEYMEFVKENPALDQEPFLSEFENDYGWFRSLGDVLRRIGLDERLHKLESLERMVKPRF